MAYSSLKDDGKSNAGKADKLGLNCPICLEVYNEPKSLACLHTFCKKCIQEYVTKKTKNGTLAGGIDCPLCRSLTTMDKNNCPTENWTDSLPANYAIISVMEAVFGENQDEPGDQICMCQPCQNKGHVIKATLFCNDCQEYQCAECTKVHGIYAFMKGHDINTIAANVTLDLSQRHSNLAMTQLDRCEVHSKRIKFYCKDDGKLCCSTCAITKHRACKDLDEIEDILKSDGNVATEAVKIKLVDMKNKVKTATDEFLNEVKKLNIQIEEIKNQILSHREELNEAFDVFEDNITKETSAFQKNKSSEINERRMQCETLAAALEGSLCTYEAVVEHGTEAQIFIAMHKLEDQFTCYEKKIGEATKLQSEEIKLDLGEDVTNALATLKSSYSCCKTAEKKEIN